MKSLFIFSVSKGLCDEKQIQLKGSTLKILQSAIVQDSTGLLQITLKLLVSILYWYASVHEACTCVLTRYSLLYVLLKMWV